MEDVVTHGDRTDGSTDTCSEPFESLAKRITREIFIYNIPIDCIPKQCKQDPLPRPRILTKYVASLRVRHCTESSARGLRTGLQARLYCLVIQRLVYSGAQPCLTSVGYIHTQREENNASLLGSLATAIRKQRWLYIHIMERS